MISNKEVSPLTSSHADARYVCRDLHAVFTLLSIQQQVKASRTSRGELAEHDVLGHTLHGVTLTVGGCLHQHIHLEEYREKLPLFKQSFKITFMIKFLLMTWTKIILGLTVSSKEHFMRGPVS